MERVRLELTTNALKGHCSTIELPFLNKWGGTDLNRQPTLYENAALTIELPPQKILTHSVNGKRPHPNREQDRAK